MPDIPSQHLPPFPEGLPEAPIAFISSQKLLDHDESTNDAVIKACQTYGFFYLNLNDSARGRNIVDQVNRIYKLTERTFDIPFSEKDKYNINKNGSQFGYKAAGTVKLTDRDRRPDTTEFFNIGKDHLFGFAESWSYPAVIEEHKQLLKDFTEDVHRAALTILRVLASRLNIPENSFTDLNRFEDPSGSHVRLTKKTAHPEIQDGIGLPSHTDFGSVTVLFNWLGGLQIESRTPGRVGEWEYVRPVPGHAIINLGDAMVKFTNGALKSAKHRVVPVPGEQGEFDRISIVYFVRPANDSLMKPLDKFERGHHVKVGGKVNVGDDDSRVFTAAEWLERRKVQMAS
ncbi:hypothetical protein NW754_001425 [Fusarium falciforme]|uniref:Fe2OG dioxygenase domain-containing protein n=1 Tax=Fusarium falciforme TaxID=195108 RepID=A0A9W8QTQ3_9HYPO|nr:hypothetical protein NW754_001425 [Fusarium falciforme]KAJ4176030.1 hypothetical protein NW755_014643 [Fusarium falciforme]KAJ4176530.1 hypothetical protein NW767_015416 [Fusarium falciforme]KAJ4224597.1 hypothetical protein NW757_014343 [Fusarium falciforme]